jgi:hypothetical protein
MSGDATEEDQEGQEGQEGQENNPPPKGKKDPANMDPPDRQEAWNRALAREKREGQAQARRELMERFGVNTEEELQEQLQELKKRQDADTDESDRLRSENERLKKVNDELKAENKLRDFNDSVKTKLADAGVPASKAGKVLPMLNLKADADEDTVDDAIAELKEDFPNLFEEQGGGEDTGEDLDPLTGFPRSSSNRKTGPPASDTGRPPRKPGTQTDPKKASHDLLLKRHPHLAENR